MSEPSTQNVGEKVWRRTFFVISAAMAAMALIDFDAGRFSHGLGDLGVAVLMISLTVQFPFVRAILKASSAPNRNEADAAKRREQLLQQAAKLRAENPWADHAGRAGWTLLATSLLLRVFGVA
ncbi:MAG: hypothetical protein ACRECQ_17590 [Burkholderiaceae bacterium]